MFVFLLFLTMFAVPIRSAVIPTNFNETESNEPVVIYNSNNETTVNGTDSITNQFAETVVDLLLDLLEKANLSRTISVIHNETELSELVEQDVDSTPITATTVRLIDP